MFRVHTSIIRSIRCWVAACGFLHCKEWDIWRCPEIIYTWPVKQMYIFLFLFFYVHRAGHRNIISILKPTRCTHVSNLIILEWHSSCFVRSFRPSSGVQDCTYGNRHMSNRYCCLLASKHTAVSVWQMPVAICYTHKIQFAYVQNIYKNTSNYMCYKNLAIISATKCKFLCKFTLYGQRRVKASGYCIK